MEDGREIDGLAKTCKAGRTAARQGMTAGRILALTLVPKPTKPGLQGGLQGYWAGLRQGCGRVTAGSRQGVVSTLDFTSCAKSKRPTRKTSQAVRHAPSRRAPDGRLLALSPDFRSSEILLRLQTTRVTTSSPWPFLAPSSEPAQGNVVKLSSPPRTRRRTHELLLSILVQSVHLRGSPIFVYSLSRRPTLGPPGRALRQSEPPPPPFCRLPPPQPFYPSLV